LLIQHCVKNTLLQILPTIGTHLGIVFFLEIGNSIVGHYHLMIFETRSVLFRISDKYDDEVSTKTSNWKRYLLKDTYSKIVAFSQNKINTDLRFVGFYCIKTKADYREKVKK